MSKPICGHEEKVPHWQFYYFFLAEVCVLHVSVIRPRSPPPSGGTSISSRVNGAIRVDTKRRADAVPLHDNKGIRRMNRAERERQRVNKLRLIEITATYSARVWILIGQKKVLINFL